VFVEAIFRVLLQCVAPEIRESYEPHRVVVIVRALELESKPSLLELFSSSNLNEALELVSFRVAIGVKLCSLRSSRAVITDFRYDRS
jgi:hypothetical protein